jgi:hypothetical protein
VAQEAKRGGCPQKGHATHGLESTLKSYPILRASVHVHACRTASDTARLSQGRASQEEEEASTEEASREEKRERYASAHHLGFRA